MNEYSLKAAANRAVKRKLPKSGFNTFIFGPYLGERDSVKRPRCQISNSENLIKHATYLRAQTRDAVRAAGYLPEFGENERILKFWSEKMDANDPGNAEMHHAEKHCGAIIIYAASVGSFCELGLFTGKESIAKKTLVLVHSDYENADSFFNRGLLRVFRQEYGQVTYVDYSNPVKCVAAALEFINDRYQKRQRDIDKVQEGAISLRL